MKDIIEIQWIKENRSHKKTIEIKELEKILKETYGKELSEMIEPISEILYIYINFDRNKKKNKSKMYIRYFQVDEEKPIDIEKYQDFYLRISEYCK